MKRVPPFTYRSLGPSLGLGLCLWLTGGCISPLDALVPPDSPEDGGVPDGSTAPADMSMRSADAAPTSDGSTTSGTLTPGTSTINVSAAGMMRSAILHVPAAARGGPLPLVIALHGNGDTNGNFVAATQLKARADAAPFVLIAPQGVRQSLFGNMLDWDAYRTVAQGNIDVPLLDALRTQLVASGSIDPQRVLVFGYSQGGYLSFRYGLDTADKLSCAAVLAAASPSSDPRLVTGAARKIAVALQIGTLDGALSQARATRDLLMMNGNPLSYNEIAGAGHVPIPGDLQVPLGFCLMQKLP